MSTCDPNIRDSLERNAKGPKTISGDEGSATQHSLKEQIEADRYLTGRDAVKKKKTRGLRLNKIRPGGTI